jgi:hypothetical protein
LRSRVARDVVVIVVVQLAVACAIGLLLPHVADLAEATRTADGVVSSETEVSKYFNDDGWLIVLGGVAGLVLGMVLQLWRGTHEVVTLLVLTVTALLAALLAGWIAEATGPADAAKVLAEAEPGDTAPVPVVIDSRVVYLVWPLTSLLGALAALLAPLSPRDRGTTPPPAASDGVSHQDPRP